MQHTSGKWYTEVVQPQTAAQPTRAYESAIDALQVELGAIEALIDRAEREFGPVLLPVTSQFCAFGSGEQQANLPAECAVVVAINEASRRASSLSSRFKSVLDRAAV